MDEVLALFNPKYQMNKKLIGFAHFSLAFSVVVVVIVALQRDISINLALLLIIVGLIPNLIPQLRRRKNIALIAFINFSPHPTLSQREREPLIHISFYSFF